LTERRISPARPCYAPLFKPVWIGQPEGVATGRPWWQFAKTPRQGRVGAGLWFIVALLQLLSAHSSHRRVSMLIAAGGAAASFLLAVGNLGSAIVLLRRQRSRALAPPGYHGPTAGK
jgi:hypothetical protein